MKEPWKVLICGARDWDDMSKIEDALADHKSLLGTKFELIIIEGGAPGADTMARIAAHKLNIHVAEVKALWGTRHRSAGPQRNEVMLMLEPDEVIAFHHNIKNSTGTKDMVSRAKKAGLDVSVIK